MSSIETQFLNLSEHHSPYSDIDPKTTLKESALGKAIFLSGASRGIGRATAVAFAQAGAKAIYVDHGEDGIKCFAIHPGGVATDLAKNMPEEIHPHLVDEPELAAGFIVWLCSGKADWASGRYLSSNWDVNELLQMKEQIINDDLLVNRLRTKS